MSRRLLVVALFLVILLAAGGIAYTLASPRLVGVAPPPGATDVPAGASLRLTFSRSMLAASVQERLDMQPGASGQFSWEENTLVFTPDQPWPSGTKIYLRLAPGSRAAGWPSLAINQEQSWSMTVENPLLAYLYPFEGLASLYTIDPKTGTIQQIAETSGEVMDFSVSPNGSTIFISVRLGEGNSLIQKLNRLTGEIVTLLECTQALCRYPQASPQGDFLAYERTDLAQYARPAYPQVWLLPLTESTSATTPEPAPFLAGDPHHQSQQPAWSSNSLLAFYDSDMKAFVFFNPLNQETRRAPSQTGLPGDWDASGDYFVFPEILTSISNPNLNANLKPIPYSHLLRYYVPDGSFLDLTQLDNLEDTLPVFSPDGKKLAFARKYLNQDQWTPGRQLWLMNMDGSNARPLTREPSYNHYDFAWDPLGDQLAYARFDQTTMTEPPELWLVNVDSTLARLLVNGGYAPQWIP